MTSSTPIDGEDSALSQDLACSFSRMQTSPTPEESKLPQELVDIIIDYLGDEKDTLSACCLVSRRWVPSARVHLFREVHISFHAYMRRYRLKRLQGTAEESSLEAPSFSHVVESFVQFTANASPWLVANIKALYITGGRWGGPFSPYASMPFEYVEQLLRNIPSLLKLSLLDMQMPWDDHPVPTEFFPLRSLILRFPGSSTPIQPVLSILAMVPDLEDLRWYPTARQGSDRALKARHHIERIEDPRFWNKLRKLATTISDGSMPYDDFLGVVGRVFPQGRQIPLEELEVGIPNVSSFELVAGLVTIFHPTIQKLTITPSFISSDRRSLQIGLARCTKLRELYLNLRGHTESVTGVKRFLPYLCPLLLADLFAESRPDKPVKFVVDFPEDMDMTRVTKSFVDSLTPFVPRGLASLRFLKHGTSLDEMERARVVQRMQRTVMYTTGALSL